MVTAGLEALILAGKAEYITVATGGSGVATIPFPKHASQMYVTDFMWMPFNDEADIIFQQDPLRINQIVIHTMALNNGKKKSYFNFRDAIYKATDTPSTRQNPLFPSPMQIHCMIESKQDIYVDIFKFRTGDGISILYDAVPLTPAQEPATPNGYGTIRQTRRINLASAQIINMGKDRDPVAAVASPRQRFEFFDDIDNLTALTNWRTLGADSNQISFPLVTFGVVIINKTQTAEGR